MLKRSEEIEILDASVSIKDIIYLYVTRIETSFDKRHVTYFQGPKGPQGHSIGIVDISEMSRLL